jgi:NAD(P)-dependent dehydrogenase (short-subunit alcohol dehydrogenase family)
MLDERVAIVTGAGRGIGEAIVRRFAREGASVVAAQRSSEDGEALVAAVSEDGGRAISIPTDVRNEASVEELVRRTIEAFGRLDILVNNAGVGIRRTVTESTMDEWDEVMEPNVRGVFLCMKYGIRPMVDQGSGSVINMASVASYVGFPRDAAYCASKGAVLMLTKQAALDYAALGIRVNAICPGFIDTPMLRYYCDQQPDPEAAWREVLDQHPMGRVGTPEDVAGAAVFLAGADSAWITGSALTVDGGLLAQ